MSKKKCAGNMQVLCEHKCYIFPAHFWPQTARACVGWPRCPSPRHMPLYEWSGAHFILDFELITICVYFWTNPTYNNIGWLSAFHYMLLQVIRDYKKCTCEDFHGPPLPKHNIQNAYTYTQTLCTKPKHKTVVSLDPPPPPHSNLHGPSLDQPPPKPWI